MARGKKVCPDCSTELGVRTHKCPNCDHVFVSKRLRDNPVDLVETPKALDLAEPTRKSRKAQWKGDKIDVDILKSACNAISIEEKGDIVSIYKPVIMTKDFQPNLVYNRLPALIQADINAKTISIWDGMVASGAPNRVFLGALI